MLAVANPEAHMIHPPALEDIDTSYSDTNTTTDTLNTTVTEGDLDGSKSPIQVQNVTGNMSAKTIGATSTGSTASVNTTRSSISSSMANGSRPHLLLTPSQKLLHYRLKQPSSEDPDSDNDDDISAVIFAADNVPYLTFGPKRSLSSENASSTAQIQQYDANMHRVETDGSRSGNTNSPDTHIDEGPLTMITRSLTTISPASPGPDGAFFLHQQPGMTVEAAEFVPDHLNSEYLQIEEEGRQRRKLLSSFKQISFTIPNVSNAFGFGGSSKKKKTAATAQQRSVSDSTAAIGTASSPLKQQRLISLTNPKDEANDSGPGVNGTERWLKYLSYTRPTWLPPKPLNDKYKHQADADALIANAIYKDRELERSRLTKINKLAKLQKAETRRWEYAHELAKKNKNSLDYVRKHEILWHGGIPMNGRLRENIWYSQIGNGLNLNNQLIDELFFGEFDNLVENNKEEIDALVEAELSKCPVQFQSLSREEVTKVVVSFLDYLRKLGVPSEKPLVDFYYNGLVHLVATFLHFYNGNTHKVFISLCNLYQRQLPSLLVQYSLTKDDNMRQFIESSLKEYIVSRLVSLLENKINNQLYHHFTYIDIEYISDILLPTMLGFMQHMFPLNLLVQIMDLYIYEGDTLLMFALLTTFKQNGAKYFGSKQEIINALSMECDVGYDFEFIDSLKENYSKRQN